jgi:hypothetical protein
LGQGKQVVELLSNCLLETGLKMKMKKCTFFHEETNYLGFVINSKGVKPDPQKVEAIRTLPTPKYCKGI